MTAVLTAHTATVDTVDTPQAGLVSSVCHRTWRRAFNLQFSEALSLVCPPQMLLIGELTIIGTTPRLYSGEERSPRQ